MMRERTSPLQTLALVTALVAFAAFGCKSSAAEDQFIDAWTAQMIAFENVSNKILAAPMPEIDWSLPTEQRTQIAVARIREDAAQYDPVIKALEALEPPPDEQDLVELKTLSVEMLRLIQDDLLNFADQAEAGDDAQLDPAFVPKLTDRLKRMIEIANARGVSTDFLLDQISGLEIGDHDH